MYAGETGASCNMGKLEQGLQTKLLMQIILKTTACSSTDLSMSCVISCESVDTPKSYAIVKEKRYYRAGVTCKILGHLI